MKKDTTIAVVIMIAWISLGFVGGYFYRQSQIPNSIPISQGALMDINMACGGNYRDLAANRRFVYANCVNPPKPVTVQNYLFR